MPMDPATMDPGATPNPEEGLLPDRWVGAPAIAYNEPTGDGRDLTDCVFTWRDPAAGIVPLMLQLENEGGHFGSVLAGFVETFATIPGGVTAEGRFYATEEGIKAHALLGGGRAFGVSIDGGATDIEWQCTALDPEGWCVSETALVHALELIGLTMVPFPAFAKAAIALEGWTAEPVPAEAPAAPAESSSPAQPDAQAAAEAAASVRAAAGPLRPPRAWFDELEPEDGDPRLVDVVVGQYGEGLSKAVPLTITESGQVYGHLAVWGQCHIGYPGVCVAPPDSPTGYAHFNKFTTVTDEGERVGTGPLVVGCDHAAARLLADTARDHYAHNGLAWADVRASRGQYGIWVAGAVRPTITEAQLEAIGRSGLSGDWRDIGGALELIAALTVPIPGFPIVRAESLAAAAGFESYVAPMPAAYVDPAGVQLSLVAAGRVTACAPCDRAAMARRRPGSSSSSSSSSPELAQVLATLERHGRLLEALERRTREDYRARLLARTAPHRV